MAINFSGTDLGLPEFPLHREICWEHGVCPIGEVNYRWSKMSKKLTENITEELQRLLSLKVAR